MKAKAITNFLSGLGVPLVINPELVIEKNGRYYLTNPVLKQIISQDFFYAGAFLGKVKNGKFFPSFNLLTMISKKGANRIIIDKKSAWLFICGRDILVKGVMRILGPAKKNSNILVVNEFGECLGFGKIIGNLSNKERSNDIAVQNVSDIGDFLRRER